MSIVFHDFQIAIGRKSRLNASNRIRGRQFTVPLKVIVPQQEKWENEPNQFDYGQECLKLTQDAVCGWADFFRFIKFSTSWQSRSFSSSSSWFASSVIRSFNRAFSRDFLQAKLFLSRWLIFGSARLGTPSEDGGSWTIFPAEVLFCSPSLSLRTTPLAPEVDISISLLQKFYEPNSLDIIVEVLEQEIDVRCI